MKNKDYFTTHKNFGNILALPLIVFFLFWIYVSKTSAQESISIGMAPTSEILELKPDQKYTGEIVVWNLMKETTTYNIVVRGFRQIENQAGTAIMLSEKEEKTSLYSASSWITINKNTLELVPNKNEKIYYEINVPTNITEGEYNVIIAFISENQTNTLGTTTFTTLSSGVPILIKVGDEFVENAELLKFNTSKNFYEEPNITFNTTIKNLGDTHITPIGEIVLTNIFDQELARIPFNENTQSILRNNTANYVTEWNFESFLTENKGIVLGPIKANLIVTYRNFQPGFSPLVSEISFWILPWKYIVLAILIIITIVILLKLRKSKKKDSTLYLPK